MQVRVIYDANFLISKYSPAFSNIFQRPFHCLKECLVRPKTGDRFTGTNICMHRT